MREARSATSFECVTMASVAPCAVDALEQREHLLLARRVEVAGRLVEQQHARPHDERAGDRDALLLAAGELRRQVVGAVGEADRRRALRARGCGARAPARPRRRAAARRCGRRSCAAAGCRPGRRSRCARRGRARGASRRASTSPRRRACTSPSVGRSRQPRMASSVVLPDPEGPMIATNSPSRMTRSTDRSAWTVSSPVS